MKKLIQALAFVVGLLIVAAPSPPLINVTGTVYDTNGNPAPGTPVLFSSISTQVTGGVEVPPTSFSALADSSGAVSVNLPQGLRVNVVIGKGAPMAVTLPAQSSIDLSALLAAVQVPPPADLLSALTIGSGGDFTLSVSNPVGAGAATLTPGNVTRLNGNPVSASAPNPGQFLIEDVGGVAWEPFSLSGDVSSSATPGQVSVGHFTLASNSSAGGFRIQNLPSPAAPGDALSEGNPIGVNAAAAGTFTSLTASGSSGPAVSNFNVNGEFNVKAYGAKGDGSNDDAASIQSAINAACAVSSSNASASTVYFPAGTYRHTTPLQLDCSNITLAGAGRNSAMLAPAFSWGPSIMVVGSGYTGIETGTSLASGAGSAMLFDGLHYWLNLRDSATLDLNGLAAFTVEAFVKPTATSDGQIVTSSGRFLASSPPTQAFSLQMVSSQLEGRLTLGATTFIVDSGSSHTLAVNTVYHVAMSWDGSTIRLFINGTQVNSQAATGTIQQPITEDVTVGPSVYDWPDGTLLGNSIQGLVDSVRISNIARYTANFTSPTSKFGADSNTLGLLNYDQLQGPLVGMYTNNGLAWLPVRRTNEPGGASEITNTAAALNNVVIRDLGIDAAFGQNGIFATVTINSVFDRLWINGTRNGLYLWSNCYQNASHNVTINSSGTASLARIGLGNIGQSGVNQFDHLRVNGGPYPLVDYEGSMLLNMPEIAQQSNTVYGAFFKAVGDSTVTLNSPILDVELGGTTWMGGLVFSSLGAGIVNGGELDSTNAAAAAIVDGGGSLSFLGNRISLGGTPPAAIHVITPPSQKIAIIEPVTVGLGSAPLSDFSSSSVTVNKDQLSGASVNGVFNVQAYGLVSGSTQNTTGTITSGSSTTLALASAIDFANGQGVAIAHAAAIPAAGAPSAPGVAATCASSCSTSYQYKVVALDGNGGTSAASSTSTSVNNNSALTYGTNYNTITLTPRVGDESYAIYRVGSAGVLALVPNTSGVSTALTFVDYGQTPITGMPTIPNSPPSSALADTLVATIAAGGSSTSLTLAVAATTPVSSAAVFHDDSQALQSIVNSLATAKAGTIFLPPGKYIFSYPVKAAGFLGLHFIGAGKENFSSSSSTQVFASRMMAGLPVFSFTNSQQSGVEELGIYGSTAGPAIAAIESRMASGSTIAHAMIYKDLFLNGQWDGGTNGGLVEGLLWSADPGFDQNNDEGIVSNVDIYETSDACVFIGHPQSLYHTFTAGNWANCATGVKQYGGAFSMHGTEVTASDAQFHAFAGSYPDPGQTIDGAKTEAPSPITAATPARLLVIDSGAHSTYFDFHGYRYEWSSPGLSLNLIDLEAPTATASFTGCTLNSQGAQNFNVVEATSDETLRFINSELSINQITYSGHLYLVGNHSTDQKAVNLSPQGSAYVLVDSGNDIGTFHNSGTLLANRGLYLTPQSPGNISGATTFDFKFGNEVDATLTGAVTLTMQNGEPAYSSGQEVSVKLCQDGTGNRVLTWPSNVRWPGGSAPTNGMTQTAGKCDWFGFRYDGNTSTGGGNTFWNLWKSQNL